MPGVPKSLGCETCRKHKKGCDKAQPSCGRCVRLGIRCVGSGVRRYKFMDAEGQGQTQAVVVSPQASPSNKTTRVTSSLVYVLEVKDIRHDVRSFGWKYFHDLPSRVGSSEALDKTVEALVTAYDAVHNKQTRVAALANFGSALELVIAELNNPKQRIVAKMYAVHNISLCQEWVGSDHPINLSRHREALANMMKDSVIKGTAGEFDHYYIYGLCQIIAYESFVNPSVRIEPWFWELLSMFGKTRPLAYQQGQTYQSVDLETYAAASFYFRAPARHRYQIECIYAMARSEMPGLRQDVVHWTAAAMVPAVAHVAGKLLVSYQTGYGVLLTVGARVGRLLQRMAGTSEEMKKRLEVEAREFVDEAVWLAKQSMQTRPFGAHFVPKFLRFVYASMLDDYRRDEMEALFLEFDHDFGETRHLNEAKFLEERFRMLEDMAFDQERTMPQPIAV